MSALSISIGENGSIPLLTLTLYHNHVNAAPTHKQDSIPLHFHTTMQLLSKITVKNVLVSIPICEIKIKKSGISHKIFKKSNWRICTESQGEEDAVATTRSLLLLYDLYPATAVVLYMLSFGIGVGTVPWLLLGELCPSKVSLETRILRDRRPSTTTCLHCKKRLSFSPSPAGMSLTPGRE